MIYDFIVVGAGVSGMSSALILARAGYSVALVEKNLRTGAIIRGFQRHGLQIDTGFHYAGGLEPGGALNRFFRYLGLADRLVPEPFDRNGFDLVRVESPGFEFAFHAGPEQLREALRQAFPAERDGIDAYLTEVERTCRSVPFLDLTADVAIQLPGSTTLQEKLDFWFSDPLLKDLLAVHGLLYGMSPEETPFTFHAAVVDAYYRSPCGLAGGGHSLAEAFDAELAKQGVELYLGCGVEVLEVTGGAFQGVRLADGRQLTGLGCIFTAHPQLLLELTPAETFRTSYRQRLEGLEDTVPACMLYGGISVPMSGQGANLFVLPRLGQIGKPPRSGVGDSPVYVTRARSMTASDADGFLAVFPVHRELLASCRPDHPDDDGRGYALFKEQIVEQMQSTLVQRCPELSGRITWCEGATPRSLRRYNHSPGLGLYGVKHSVSQINPQPLTKIRGLLLAGQGIAAPGILGATCSAFITCGLVLGHDRLKHGLLACH
ncbi:MAG: phytoene desaturase family protein [Desulfuromonadales bacterium]